MEQLLVHALATWALWYALFESSLPGVSTLREWLVTKSNTFYTFATCPVCSGFWCSLVLSLPVLHGFDRSVFDFVTLALSGSATTYLIQGWVLRTESR